MKILSAAQREDIRKREQGVRMALERGADPETLWRSYGLDRARVVAIAREMGR